MCAHQAHRCIKDASATLSPNHSSFDIQSNLGDLEERISRYLAMRGSMLKTCGQMWLPAGSCRLKPTVRYRNHQRKPVVGLWVEWD